MKFWSFKNSISNTDEVELILYGIISKTSWWNDKVTPEQFAQDLAACNGRDVRVRIDSDGGDVFAAHNICNQLKNYTGNVTICIDGLAASAATIIMTAGKVIMPIGSMMMIHNPELETGYGSYNADQLASMSVALKTIKQNIIDVYMQKCNLSAEKLTAMMNDETWLTASMAKEYGFADEIENTAGSGELIDQEEDYLDQYGECFLMPPIMDGNFLIVNSNRHDINKLKNVAGLRAIIAKEKPQIQNKQTKREEKQLIIKNTADVKTNYPELYNQIVEETIKNETARIAGLDAIDDISNKAVHEIVNSAKKSRKTAEEIQTFVDIIKKNTPETPTATNVAVGHPFAQIITDSAQSGVNGIGAGTGDDTKTAENKEINAAADYMASIINKKNGVTK